MTRKPSQTSITGRDGYIVNQALLYAIAHIQNLPEEMQEWSNMRDMCLIVRTNMSPFIFSLLDSVEHHTGKALTLWPEPDEYLREEECKGRDQFEALRRNWKRGCELMKAGKIRSVLLNDGQVTFDDARLESLGVGAPHDGVDFLDSGPFPNESAACVEMTPEDEASIRGEAA